MEIGDIYPDPHLWDMYLQEARNRFRFDDRKSDPKSKPTKTTRKINHVSLDIDKLMKSMNQELKSLQTLSDNCCIYRVPTGLRKINPRAYTPQVVSIGPYHYGKKELAAMEDHKRRYFHDFLRRMIGKGMDEKIYEEEFENESLKDINGEELENESSKGFNGEGLENESSKDSYGKELENESLKDSYGEELENESLKGFNGEELENESLKDINGEELEIESLKDINGVELENESLKDINGEELENKSLKDLFECTAKWEKSLRDSYAETINMDSEVFVKMMLVDASFIVEYLLKRYRKKWKKNDRIFDKQRMTNIVRFDILLIENQIPYFFLEELFNLLPINDHHQQEKVSMKDLVDRFLKDTVMWDLLVKDDSEVQHLVHFLQIGLRKSDLSEYEADATTENKDQVAPPTISDLHRAGVKFKASSTSESLFNIKFNDGILVIPKWKLTNHTEILFRNIQAFEQCHCFETTLTHYITIMDFLVNTSEDIKLLVENGIIENWLMDDQAAATLINRLGAHNLIRRDDFRSSKLFGDLNRYYKDPLHNWKATLKQRYFNNPWSVISVIAAAFLILLALIQAVCTVIPLV